MKHKSILITGGAGFIGSNCALFFFKEGWNVYVLDNLSRRGSESNLEWIKANGNIEFIKGDIRDYGLVSRVINEIQPSVVLHLAAQVAVTTSVQNPMEDFEINAIGTLNIIESIREHSASSFFINASTNKVYGKMDAVGVAENETRYSYENLTDGVSEAMPLDFYSPYGCSKGTADQYTMDYKRIYGLRTVTIRQSCIYGPRQFGIEDQGWVAWFAIAAMSKSPITIYGDGKQVRDILHVEDLASAYLAAIDHADIATGHAFNIGGGLANTVSLLEYLVILEDAIGTKIPCGYSDWRPGDQKIFVSDIAKAKKLLNWSPKINVRDGVNDLVHWVSSNRSLFK